MEKPEHGKILVLEDESSVGEPLCERLRTEGYGVDWHTSIQEATDAIRSASYSLALVDVGLPDGSGFDFAKELRMQTPATAIVFLTAYNDPESRIKGLELGAEDYLPKPFYFKELLLRIRNAIKRAGYFSGLSGTGEESVQFGKAEIDFSEFSIVIKGQSPHRLTHKECALLKFLLERETKVVSRDEILNHVWSNEEFPTPRTIDNFILKFRKWIEPNPDSPVHIVSVRGVGYQVFIDPPEQGNKK